MRLCDGKALDVSHDAMVMMGEVGAGQASNAGGRGGDGAPLAGSDEWGEGDLRRWWGKERAQHGLGLGVATLKRV